MTDTYSYDALPLAVFGSAGGNTVTLQDLLTNVYGNQVSSIASVQIAYRDAAYFQWADPDFSYWDPTNPVVTRVLSNGVDIGGSGAPPAFNQTTVANANFGNITINVGNNIMPNVYLTIELANNGTDRHFQELNITTVPDQRTSLAVFDGSVTANDIVATARTFATAYNGVANANDCHWMAMTIAAAAGAAFDPATQQGAMQVVNPATGAQLFLQDPSLNEEGGLWRIVHRGSGNPVDDWQTLVQPGDIVRMGWSFQIDPTTGAVTGGGFHTVTVTAGLNADGLHPGQIRVVDNTARDASGNPIISEHWVDFDGTATIDNSVTIYRVSLDQRYLTNGSALSDTIIGTVLSDHIRGGNGGDTINGGGGNDFLVGEDGGDTLRGGDGNDSLYGGAGDDTMYGGAGDDTYLNIDSPNDQIIEEDTTSAGGVDTVVTTINRNQYLPQGVENLTLVGSATRGDGNDLDNTIVASSQSCTLRGYGGRDTLIGYDGNDVFIMDNGNSTGGDVAVGDGGRVGGNSIDEVWADDSVAATGLHLNLFAKGTNYAALSLVPNTSAAMEVEVVRGGSGNDWVDATRLGSGESVRFFGNGGNDTFYSNAANNVFEGGADTDTIVYSGPASNYIITASTTDSSLFSIQNRFTGQIDYVRDVELARFNGVTTTIAASTFVTGTEGADVLVGDAANNIMDGRGGDDVMTGGLGADSFVGGAGRDLMYVDAQDISIQGGDGFDIVYADASTAATGLRFALAGTGVEAAFGGAGSDVLDASGTGYFTKLFGGDGNDVLIASSAGTYTLQGGAGSDTAVFAGNQSDYAINGNPAGWPSWMTVVNKATGDVTWLQTVERLQFADGTIDAPVPPLNALGTAGADVINAAAGGEVIHGFAGNDRLTGAAGDDVLDGGAGADRMSGGAGNDSFFIDNSDTLVDGGEGWDSIYVDDTQGRPGSVRFALAGTNVEFAYGGVGNDVFDASGVSGMVELWGQWGDDVLTGGSGDDTLLGDEWLPGGGNDLLDGGAGNDWLDGGNGNDTFVFRLGSGVDTLYDFGQTYHFDRAAGIDAMEPGDRDFIRIEGGPFASFAALAGSGAMVQSGANVVITLSATDQITLRNVQLGTLDASDFLFTNQAINGTSNADTLSGQGSDTIRGFGGNDLILGTGNLTVASGDEGGDQLYFQGDQNQLSGGEGNDWLGVNGNNNALMGGAGDESWIGASGNGNTLAGGDGGDALFANGTGNYLHGENGNDWLGVSGSQNRLYGGAGSEWMGASGNGNLLFGGEGGDTLFSVGGNVLYGETGDDWLGCSGNGNVLNGAQGNDYLAASGNNNTLDGGAGNDVLLAGGAHGGDRFVFHAGYGMDTVVNFSRHGAGGSDVVDLNGFGLNFSSLQGYMADVGGDVVITLDAATVLTIDGISKGQLQAGDFLF